MKVRLKEMGQRHATPATGRSVTAWLRAGRDYNVLSIEGDGKYRIESEQSGTPALFDSGMFDVVDASRPTSWVMRGDSLLPERWAARGFWEAFFDGEPDAVRIYREELERMKT